MATDFSFGKLMAHLTAGAALPRPEGQPTEKHMHAAVQGYLDNLNNPDAEYASKYLALPRTIQDPVGTETIVIRDGQNVLKEMEQLIDVPFTPTRAERTSPISFSLGNTATLAFKLWADVDGHEISIDIIEVFTFDGGGKVADQMAYWGVDNVTVLS